MVGRYGKDIYGTGWILSTRERGKRRVQEGSGRGNVSPSLCLSAAGIRRRNFANSSPCRRCFLSVPAQSTSLVQMPSELDLLAVKRRAICLYYATAVGFVIFICALNVQTNEWLNKSFTFLFFTQPPSLSLSLSLMFLFKLSFFLSRFYKFVL